MASKKLTDFGQPIDVPLLDATVAAFNGSESVEERNAAEQNLQDLQNNPDMWLQVMHILQNTKTMDTKLFALKVLEGVRWNALPVEQRDMLKNYIYDVIIQLSSNEDSYRMQRLYVDKLNVILVQILKQELPANLHSFILDLVSAAKTSETICENCMVILKLLRVEVSDISVQEMIQERINELTKTLNRFTTFNSGFLSYINQGKLIVPQPFEIGHWWRFRGHDTLKIQFPGNDIEVINWVSEAGSIRLDVGCIMTKYNLANGDYVIFSHNHFEGCRLLNVVSFYDPKRMFMTDFKKGRDYNTYINQVTSRFQRYVIDIVDDGSHVDDNNGYKCIANGLGTGFDGTRVRNELIDEVSSNSDKYESLGATTDLVNDLSFGQMEPGHGILIATKYNIVLMILNRELSELFVPQYNVPPDGEVQFIVLCLVDEHRYVLVRLSGSFPVPTLSGMTLERNSYGWEDYFTRVYSDRYEGNVNVAGNLSNAELEMENNLANMDEHVEENLEGLGIDRADNNLVNNEPDEQMAENLVAAANVDRAEILPEGGDNDIIEERAPVPRGESGRKRVPVPVRYNRLDSAASQRKKSRKKKTGAAASVVPSIPSPTPQPPPSPTPQPPPSPTPQPLPSLTPQPRPSPTPQPLDEDEVNNYKTNEPTNSEIETENEKKGVDRLMNELQQIFRMRIDENSDSHSGTTSDATRRYKRHQVKKAFTALKALKDSLSR